jgi:glycosyltransferase involved in cell wall biosynthesis
MHNLTVTAAIPVYNGAEFIGPTVESLLTQSRPAEEIIVIDDGSTDQTAEICLQYPVRLSKHGENRGLAVARNSALKQANSDLIVFIDSDARAANDLLLRLAGAYTDPEIGGVGGQGIESNIHSVADRWRRAHASQSHGKKERGVDHLFGLCMSYRLAVIREVGGFNPEFRTNGEDVDVGLRIKAAGYLLWYLPQAIVYHQRTDDVPSLLQTMANWYTAGYRAKKINKAHPWRLFFGVFRHMMTDTTHDLLVERDIKLARLSWQVNWAKFHALWIASSL